MKRQVASIAVMAAAGALLAGSSHGASAGAAATCGNPLPQGSDHVTIPPYDFVSTIDNNYWPMAPGSRWVYSETDKSGAVTKDVVEVKNRTKPIIGVGTTVVRDTATQGAKVVEDTRDWYAQDVCGNIWYFGENTKEYDNGQVSTKGSWMSGVMGAEPGVVVAGDPQVGLTYREEYWTGKAEDAARILSLDEQVHVASGHYSNMMLTKNYTPLEPRGLEYKFYAPGVGPAEEITVSGGSDRAELQHFHLG
jgi:hypothetical protein